MTLTTHATAARSPDAALAATIDAHGAVVVAYAEAVVPGQAHEVAAQAVRAARAQLPAAGRAAESEPVARAAVYHHLRAAAGAAVAHVTPGTCAAVPPAIARLANGELSAQDEGRLRAHVGTCKTCEGIAQRFTAGERLLASPRGGPVPLWLYEAASDGPPGRLAGLTAGPRAGGRALGRGALGGIALIVLVLGAAFAASGLLGDTDDKRASRLPAGPSRTPAATASATATAAATATPTPATSPTAELTGAERAATSAAARDRQVNLARERRALTRERQAARRAAAERRERIEARRRAAQAPAPTPVPTAVPTPVPVVPPPPPPPAPRATPTPKPKPKPTPTPRPRPTATPSPDPPGRVPPPSG